MNNELKNKYEELNNTISYQIERLKKSDEFVENHMHRVSVIVSRICRKLDLDEEFISYCTICGYLHDIGKVFIPNSILQNKGRLSNEEYEMMKKHTIYGFNFCYSMPSISKYAKGAREHHENYNGTGYPDRLKDKEISLEGKIIKLADIYDALVSRRVYKQCFSKIKAINIIKEDVLAGKIDSSMFNILVEIVVEDLEAEILMENNELKKLELEKEKEDLMNELLITSN